MYFYGFCQMVFELHVLINELFKYSKWSHKVGYTKLGELLFLCLSWWIISTVECEYA